MSNTGFHVHSLSERAEDKKRWDKDGASLSVMTGRSLGCWKQLFAARPRGAQVAPQLRENGHLRGAHACSHVKGRQEKSEVSFGAHMALQGIDSTQ